MRQNRLNRLRGGSARWAAVLLAVATALLVAVVWAVPGSRASTTRSPQALRPHGDTLVIALAEPDSDALSSYVAQLQRRGSAEYHRFLTPTGFAARFGAPAREISAVRARLRALGLTHSTLAADHLYISVRQPGAEELATRDPRRAAAISPAKVAGALAHALGPLASAVITPAQMPVMAPGLIAPERRTESPTRAALIGRRADVADRRAAAIRPGVDGGATPCQAAVASGAYTAPQLASAYNFDGMYAAGYHGEGMTAAVVEYGGYHSGNIAAFDSCYGVHTPVRRVLVDGGAGSAAGESEGEVSLDIETLNELAPDLAGIDVYEAPNTGPGELDAYDAFVSADAASVLSVSWGECEEGASQSYERLLGAITEQAAVQGQQIFVAAGDAGSTECKTDPLPTGHSLSTDTEAALPWVTGVGGTDLSQASTQPAASVHREAVWNDGIGAGGGGQSVVWTMPSWQRDYLVATGVHPAGMANDCGAPVGDYCRMEPDIAFDADGEEGGADPSVWGVPAGPKPAQFANVGDRGSPGYAVYCASANCGGGDAQGSGWQPVGGTSAATPVAAAAAVLWDQQAKASGVALGFLDPSLYAIAADPSDYARDFYDVTSGDNDDQYTDLACLGGCGAHLYSAGVGYDMATGLGSVNVADLGSDLVGDAGAVTLTPDYEQMYGYTGSGPSTTAPVSISVPANAATGNGYTASSDAAWLVVDRAGGTAPARLAWRVDPHGLAAGRYSGLITVTGPRGSTATLAVHYTVTAPGSIRLLTPTLHFSERQVRPDGASGVSVCTDPLWGDELEFHGTLPGAVGLSAPGDQVPSTRRSLIFTNGGSAGSALHYSISQVHLSWAGNDADPYDNLVGFQKHPAQPLVPSQGTLGAGATARIRLASDANTNRVSGEPAYQQGTYRGSIQITDLADPADHATVPVTLTLGNGRGTPRLGTDRRSITVSAAPGQRRVIELGLTDPGGACGYGYSLSTNATWLASAPARRAGTVQAHRTWQVPLEIDVAAGMAPGTYHAAVTVGSTNAAQASLSVPVTLTVREGRRR